MGFRIPVLLPFYLKTKKTKLMKIPIPAFLPKAPAFSGLIACMFSASAPAALVSFNTTTDNTTKDLYTDATATTAYTTATNNGQVTVGNNTAEAADNTAVWASLAETYTLANAGDSLLLSGNVQLTGITTASGEFRFGLFDQGSSVNANGWLGYWASNDNVTGSGVGEFRERNSPNTGFYVSGTGATALTSYSGATVDITSGTHYYYQIQLTLNSLGGIDYSADLYEVADSSRVLLSVSGTDSTPNTYAFGRAGFLLGNNLNADQANFTNTDATFSPVPEPSAAVLGGLGTIGWVLGFRRRRLA